MDFKETWFGTREFYQPYEAREQMDMLQQIDELGKAR
jgi:hypothetical protein